MTQLDTNPTLKADRAPDRPARARGAERIARRHGPVALLYLAAAFVCMLPMFSAGSPPGVDAPTFLHLGWVVELALTGRLDSLFIDPYWYGGFPYLQSYPPLAYGLIGVLSAATPLPVEIAYRLVLLLAFAGLGLATYALALELGVRRLGATLGGLLVMTSHPALLGLGVYGWFTTLVALPLGVAGLTLLERSIRLDNTRLAVVSGMLFAATVLAHHMTGFAFAIGMTAWTVFRLAAGAPDAPRGGRRRVLRPIAVSGATAIVISGPWLASFAAHLLNVGFQREVPGNWQVSFTAFLRGMLDRSLITVETYPTYLGVAQVALAVAGLWLAVLARSRAVAVVPVVLAMAWFAAGQDINPLIERYPFSGLDLARFALFVMPFAGVLAGLLLDAVVAAIAPQSPLPSRERARACPELAEGARVKAPSGHGTGRARQAWLAAVVAVAAIAVPIADVIAARPALASVRRPDAVDQAIAWLRDETPPDAAVLAVGLRYWNAWWLPHETGRPIMDGWNDEGAPSWRPVREVRLMAWRGEVDAERLHARMAERGARYLLVAEWSPSEHPQAFIDALERAPEALFEARAHWPGAVVYEIVER